MVMWSDFKSALDYLYSVAASPARLARELGVSTNTVKNWYDAKEPININPDKMARVVRKAKSLRNIGI